MPACFEPLPPELTDFVKKLFREIIDTGFRSGLLRQGMVQYPGGQPMGDAAEVTHFAWSNVRPIVSVQADQTLDLQYLGAKAEIWRNTT